MGLNGGKIKDSDGKVQKESIYLEQWSKFDKQKKKQLNKLWGGEFKLANLRNDVLHAGFRKNPKNAREVLEETKKIVEELKNIAEQWCLEDESV